MKYFVVLLSYVFCFILLSSLAHSSETSGLVSVPVDCDVEYEPDPIVTNPTVYDRPPTTCDSTKKSKKCKPCSSNGMDEYYDSNIEGAMNPNLESEKGWVQEELIEYEPSFWEIAVPEHYDDSFLIKMTGFYYLDGFLTFVIFFTLVQYIKEFGIFGIWESLVATIKSDIGSLNFVLLWVYISVFMFKYFARLFLWILEHITQKVSTRYNERHSY